MHGPAHDSVQIVRSLEALLAKHFETHQLVGYPKTRSISRGWYKDELKIGRMTSALTGVFDRYDQLAADAMKVDEHLVERVRQYTVAARQLRTLAVFNGKVNRKRIELIFGFPNRFLTNETALAEMVDAIDLALPSSGYIPNTRAITLEDRERANSSPVKWSVFAPQTLTSRAGELTLREPLVAILKEHLASGSLRRNRYGRIAKSEYALLLGCDEDALTNYRDVFEHYERLAGGVRNPLEDKIPEIKAWFDASLLEGTLPLFGDNLNEQEVRNRFGITRKGLKGCPPLQELFKELSDTVRTSYQSPEKRRLETALRSMLPKATLNDDGLTVNRRALERRLKCTDQALSRRPLIGIVREHETRVRAEVEADPLKVVLHDRAIDFSPLLQWGWRREIAAKVRDTFKGRFSREKRDEVNRLKVQILKVFEYLGKSSATAEGAARSAINDRHELPRNVWSKVLDAIGLRLGVSANTVRHINKVMSALADESVVPRSDQKVPLGRKSKRAVKSRKTVAELVGPTPTSAVRKPGPENTFTIDHPDPASSSSLTPIEQRPGLPRDYIAFARWILMQKSSVGDSQAQYSGEDFLRVLEKELELFPDSLPADPVQAISSIIGRRLDALHKPARDVFARWKRHYEEGQELLAQGVDPAEYEFVLFGEESRRHPTYNATLRRYFPLDGPGRRQGLANLLRLVNDRHKGLVPKQSSETEAETFFAVRCREYSSLLEVQAHLVLHPDAIGAAIVMYMVESGCNVAVARTLYADCIEDTDELGYKKVTGEKARAQGRPIVVNLPHDSDALSALSWINANRERAQKLADPDDKNLLFLIRRQGAICEVSQAWFGDWFKRFVSGIGPLSRLAVTPVMIRPSRLLKHALDNDGDLRMGLAYAQHDKSNTGVYQVRLPTKYIYDRLYALFQKRLERIVLKMAGLLKPHAAEQFEEGAKPIGIGGVCRIGGCAALKCWNDCPSLAVVADPNSMADWQIWNISLKAVRGDWERDRIDRWEDVWLPFLCFTDVLAEKVEKFGSMAIRKIWKKATEIRIAKMSDPSFVMPRPF